MIPIVTASFYEDDVIHHIDNRGFYRFTYTSDPFSGTGRQDGPYWVGPDGTEGYEFGPWGLRIEARIDANGEVEVGPVPPPQIKAARQDFSDSLDDVGDELGDDPDMDIGLGGVMGGPGPGVDLDE